VLRELKLALRSEYMGVSSPLQQVKTSAQQNVAIWEWVGTCDEHVMSSEDNHSKRVKEANQL